MREQQLHRARLVSSVAATMISLACGTNVCLSHESEISMESEVLNSTIVRLLGLGAAVRR